MNGSNELDRVRPTTRQGGVSMMCGIAAFAALTASTPGSTEPRASVGPEGMQSDIRVTAKDQSPTAGPANHFTGSVTVTSPFTGSEARLGGATVTFQPGARTNWHTHPLGQLLIVMAGRGWVRSEGGPAREFGPGDTVWIAPGVKHWHGATRTGAMTHVAVAEALDGQSVTWLEPVSDADYHGP